MQNNGRSLAIDLLIGAGAGIVATAVTGGVDRFLSGYVSTTQRLRERRVRRRSAHAEAAWRVGQSIGGRWPSRRARRTGSILFGTGYGALWGVIYAAVRRQAPVVSSGAGVPFAVPFFLACDGLIAPLAGLTPGLRRLPWQVNAKELANHVAWTATAELTHRTVCALVDRARKAREDREARHARDAEQEREQEREQELMAEQRAPRVVERRAGARQLRSAPRPGA